MAKAEKLKSQENVESVAERLVKDYKRALWETPEFASKVAQNYLNGDVGSRIEFKKGEDEFEFHFWFTGGPILFALRSFNLHFHSKDGNDKSVSIYINNPSMDHWITYIDTPRNDNPKYFYDFDTTKGAEGILAKLKERPKAAEPPKITG